MFNDKKTDLVFLRKEMDAKKLNFLGAASRKEVAGAVTFHPSPGFLIKFKKVNISQPDEQPEYTKVFINVTHSSKMYGPKKKVTEAELGALLERGGEGIDIPIELAHDEVEGVEDHNGEKSAKFDVVVNSDMYNKAKLGVASSPFRALITQRICHTILEQCYVKLNPWEAIYLTKPCHGEISPFTIKPSYVQEIAPLPANPLASNKEKKKNTEEKKAVVHAGIESITLSKGEEASSHHQLLQSASNELLNPAAKQLESAVRMKIRREGEYNEVEIRMKINVSERIPELDVKASHERIIVAADGRRSLYDIRLPIDIRASNTVSSFVIRDGKGVLIVTAPVVLTRGYL